jgi:hypothetical protein
MGLKTGQTNNPKGKPHKFDTYKALFDDLMKYTEAELKLLENDETAPLKVKMCIKMARQAMEGKLKASEMIMDRSDGKPSQKVEGNLNDFNITVTNPDFDNV